MDYQLSLSPDILLSLGDFVAAWNVTTECRAVAEAHLISHNVVVLETREDREVAVSAIEKLVKEVLRREGISGITITHQDTQNSTQLLTVNNKDR